MAVASTIKRLAADPAANGDCVTFCFPPASKLQGAHNHAIKNSHRTNLAALNKMVADIAAAGDQAPGFKNKTVVNSARMDRVDHAALAQMCNSFNDGRSLARERVYGTGEHGGVGYGLSSLDPRVNVAMVFPDVVKPSLENASVSSYFVARLTLVASMTGRVNPRVLSGGPNGEMLSVAAGERLVGRDFCLFKMAADVFTAVVRHSHEWEDSTVFPLAECLRDSVVESPKAWRTALARTSVSEEFKLPGSWGLLIPRLSKRDQLDKAIRTLGVDELAPMADGYARSGSGAAPSNDNVLQDDGGDACVIDHL